MEKTLIIQNNGGEFFTKITKNSEKVSKNKNNINEPSKVLKTAGGVFFSLVKKECPLTKAETKIIFNNNNQNRKLERQNNQMFKEL